MPTAYTSLLGLALPVTGELSGTWGDTVNDYITKYLDSSVAGTQTISGSQTAVTLTRANGGALSPVGSGSTGSSQYQIINCTGNPAGTLTITVDVSTGTYALSNSTYSQTFAVINATSTSQSVVVRATTTTGTSTGVTLVAGEKAVIAWNGSDFIKVATSAVDGVSTIAFGTTGLTPSTATSGAVTVAGTLVAANGGTGQSSYTTGDLLYATGSTALSKLGIGTNGQVLTSTGTAPQWSTLSGVAVTTFSAGTTGFTPSTATSGAVTLAGTLATTNGGTGLTSFTANGVVYASSSSALTTGSALTFTGTNFGIGVASPVNKFAVASSGVGYEIDQTSLANTNLLLSYDRGASAYRSVANYYGGNYIWNDSGSEQMRLTSTGLGIGTSSPAYKLDVNGSIRSVNNALFGTNGTSTATVTVGGSPTGNYSSAIILNGTNAAKGWVVGQNQNVFGALEFIQTTANGGNTIGGTASMLLDSSGNLGLGVTPSAWGAGSQALQNGGGSFFQYNNDRVIVGQNTYIDTSFGDRFIGNGYATRYRQYAGTHAFYVSTVSNSSGAGASQSLTQAMTLDASGNLGVGTTSPNFFGSGTKGITVNGSSGSHLEMLSNGASLGFLLANSNGLQLQTNSNNPLVFNTNNTERLRIASNGAWGLAGANYGTSGQVLTSNGSGSAPTWQNAGGGGGSAATPTALGTVYGKTDTSSLAFLGYQAGNSNTGTGNTAVGYQAAYSNTTGEYLEAFGYSALRLNTTGVRNSAFGTSALYSNTTGNYNVAVGFNTLQANTTASNNTAVGYQAGYSNTTGGLNTYIGLQAGYSNTVYFGNTGIGSLALYYNTGQSNTAVGGNNNSTEAALQSNTSGSYNTAMGVSALGKNTTASYNTAVGYQALYSNTTTERNIAIGHQAGYFNTAAKNLFIGYQAGYSNTTGTGNSFVGGSDSNNWPPGYYNTTGSDNTALGGGALRANTTGSSNVAIGTDALHLNTTTSGHVAVGAGALKSLATGAVNSVAIGQNALTTFNPSSNATNTAVGGSALSACTTGAGNVALGRTALTALTTGQVNVAIGSDDGVGNWAGTLKSLTTGSSNIAIGPNALTNLTTGGKNIGIGERALQNATTPNHNIAIGCVGGSIGNGPLQSCTTGAINIAIGGEALASLTTANGNTAVGYGSMIFATTAPNNTAVGGYTLAQTTTGEANTAVGYQAGNSNTTGIWNTLNGYQSGYYITTGSQNTLIGAYNGNYVVQLTTGSYNIHLGTYCYSSSSSVNNEIVIGYNNAGKGANTGFITSTSGVYQGNNSSSWSTTSDFRLKKNIVDNNEGLEKIAAIRVRNFEYRTAEEITELPAHTVIKKAGVQLGVIAQELQQVCPDCVKEESTGVLSVDSDNVFWHMVNAIKQLKAEVDSLKAQINQGA